MAPRWQRARVVKDEDPTFIGKLIWVRAEPPKLLDSFSIENPSRRGIQPSIEMNCTGDAPVYAPMECIELLPEFADEVPLIPWKQFVAECHAQKESR